MKQNKQMSPDIKVALHNGVKFDSAGLGEKKKKTRLFSQVSTSVNLRKQMCYFMKNQFYQIPRWSFISYTFARFLSSRNIQCAPFNKHTYPKGIFCHK